ncbi:hypothetical protein BDR06DRAFT_971998 [Suillus hirtellus]|nr:hypothetical protein BDR06DRAFT_971998 [Suillus hirtellus]
MTESSNSGPPAGAGGKNTNTFNPTGKSGQMTENEAACLTRFISQTNDHEVVVEENLWCFERNLVKAQLQEDPNYIEVLLDDEDLLEEPMVEDDKGCGLFEIPRPLLNLAKAKVHILLTLLMNAALWKMHEDPSCIKLKKGLVLNNPKIIIMDMTSGFPPELMITTDIFFEALSNFLKLLALVTDDDMDKFTSNFSAVLRFNIETCRRFFNTSVFLDMNVYKEHWSEVKIDLRMDHEHGNIRGVRYNLYSPYRPDGPSGMGTSNDGKPFWRSKGDG